AVFDGGRFDFQTHRGGPPPFTQGPPRATGRAPAKWPESYLQDPFPVSPHARALHARRQVLKRSAGPVIGEPAPWGEARHAASQFAAAALPTPSSLDLAEDYKEVSQRPGKEMELRAGVASADRPALVLAALYWRSYTVAAGNLRASGFNLPFSRPREFDGRLLEAGMCYAAGTWYVIVFFEGTLPWSRPCLFPRRATRMVQSNSSRETLPRASSFFAITRLTRCQAPMAPSAWPR